MKDIEERAAVAILRLTKQPLGLLMNFGCATFREGVKRVVNNHDFASSRLRVNQIQGQPQQQ